MNLISFETPPPLGRQESTAATAATFKQAKEASTSGTCFHGSHLDLSLGISLSPGGGCGCGGASMASYNGRRGVGDVGRVQSSGMMAGTTIANTLSAGHGGNLHGIVSSTSSSWTAAFMPSPTGFMHPWSLAARQQKAAAEQDRSLMPAATTYVTR
jgi:auxin-responsive protein IAA